MLLSETLGRDRQQLTDMRARGPADLADRYAVAAARWAHASRHARRCATATASNASSATP